MKKYVSKPNSCQKKIEKMKKKSWCINYDLELCAISIPKLWWKIPLKELCIQNKSKPMYNK